jgi:hypothetical protein
LPAKPLGESSQLRHWRPSAILAAMEQTETKVFISPLRNLHYPSEIELREKTRRLIENPSWPFNPNFPQAFSFPAFGTAEWLAIAWWDACKGDAAKVPDKIKAGAKLNWQYTWEEIYIEHSGPPPPPVWIPDTTNYSMKHPEGWVQTLLDAERFWFFEINVWALEMVKSEFHERNKSSLSYPFALDGNQCEHLCRRFHAYQQARYRWHEHLLEKHCERALGASHGYGHTKTAAQARASLIGWFSKQKGFEEHPLATALFKGGEKTAFDSERANPSSRRYRTTSSPDEMGWLILTWPVWNFSGWRWSDIAEAVIKKFRFVDAKGKPLDFLKTSRKRLQKALRENFDANGSMPAEKALALFYEYLCNPTSKEKEMHGDHERTVRIRIRRNKAKAIEKVCRLAIGSELEKKILKRPIGRGTDKEPLLWDFAQKISA